MNATEEPIITISGSYVTHELKNTPVDKFCRLVADNTITGMSSDPIPDNVRWLCERGAHSVYIVELQPELRQVRWSDNCDHCCDAATRTIATPYVVLKVPFHGKYVGRTVEVFYRNKPLTSLDDTLCLTNLRNISVNHGHPGYMCTDGLSVTGGMNLEAQLSALVNHLWTGLFNRYKGFGTDHFWQYKTYGHDDRVKDIKRWEEESLKNPEFVLGVEWLPASNPYATGTVRGVIESFFTQTGGIAPQVSSQLGNLILKS